MDSGQLFTWETLGTIGSASLLVFFIVQYTKDSLIRYLKFIPTDLYAVIVSFFILLAAGAADGQDVFDWKVYVLAFFNSFVVASTSAQIYTKTKNPPVTRSSKAKQGDSSSTVSTDDTTSSTTTETSTTDNTTSSTI